MIRSIQNEKGLSIIELITAQGMLVLFVGLFGASFTLFSKIERAVTAVNERMSVTNSAFALLNSSATCKCIFKNKTFPTNFDSTTHSIALAAADLAPYADTDNCASKGTNIIDQLRLSHVNVNSMQLTDMKMVNDDTLFANLKIEVNELKSTHTFNTKSIALAFEIEKNTNFTITNCKGYNYVSDKEDYPEVFQDDVQFGTVYPWPSVGALIPGPRTKIYNLNNHLNANYFLASFVCDARRGSLANIGQAIHGYVTFRNSGGDIYTLRGCTVTTFRTTETDSSYNHLMLRIPSSATHIVVGADFTETPDGSIIGTRRVFVKTKLLQ